MEKIKIFDRYYNDYDSWFDENKYVYQSELKAIRHFIPKGKKGLEVGVGTGRIAKPLGIKYGVEPSENMAEIAKHRGIKVYKGIAEKLPFKDKSFDYILFITTLCFVRNVLEALKESKRLLRNNGSIIIGVIDKGSPLGKKYLQKKKNSKFYKNANFHSVEEITILLEKIGFDNFEVIQTIFNKESIIQNFKNGFGKGLFVVLKAELLNSI